MENHDNQTVAEHLARLSQGVKEWNIWREQNKEIVIDLHGTNLSPIDLFEANLSGANLSGANLNGAYLIKTNLNGANLTAAQLIKANLTAAQLIKANLAGADLTEAQLVTANLSGADLNEANLTGANFPNSNLTGANLNGAILNKANFTVANLTDVNIHNVEWDRRLMRRNFFGVRGIDSCYGNPILKRAISDQDYLDALEFHWGNDWRICLFWAWGIIDYGRSLSRIIAIAFLLIALYGFIYSLWPELLGLDCNPCAKECEKGHQIPNSWFTPYYFSIVTYTTLGFGDISAKTLSAEIIVSSEVLVGYMTLGLLLSVLAEKIARRS